MTSFKAKRQLAECIRRLHLEDGSFSIRRGHLVSSNGVLNIPVRNLIGIIPAHGTVMAVMRRD